MRNKIIYMVGALLSSTILISGCSNDDIPSYSELTIDKNEVFIKVDSDTPTAEVNITEGNGNYKVTVDNENIAVATLEGTQWNNHCYRYGLGKTFSHNHDKGERGF